jgi:hypothetical protein
MEITRATLAFFSGLAAFCLTLIFCIQDLEAAKYRLPSVFLLVILALVANAIAHHDALKKLHKGW